MGYQFDWWSTDGGGGTSTGRSYAVSGSIGQPDAGTLSGGNFTLQLTSSACPSPCRRQQH